MLMNLKYLAAASVIAMGAPAFAQNWTLDGAASKLAFGSVKKDNVGETHSFETLSGSVSAEGQVSIDIDLASVQTNIDIRNERMLEHVFQSAKTANISATLDVAALNAMAVGTSDVVDVSGVVSLVGTEVALDAEMFVMRVSDTQVLVSTNDIVWLAAEDAGIMAGLDKLMELAKLPGITRTSPVTMRFIFNAGDQVATSSTSNAATQVAAVAGDVEAGKKVFRKCRSCHKVEEGKNSTGPSLYKVVGRPAAQIEGFKYSKAMKESGLTWDADTLAEFLAKPKALVPKTRMSFPGLKKEDEIENVIAYLNSL